MCIHWRWRQKGIFLDTPAQTRTRFDFIHADGCTISHVGLSAVCMEVFACTSFLRVCLWLALWEIEYFLEHLISSTGEPAHSAFCCHRIYVYARQRGDLNPLMCVCVCARWKGAKVHGPLATERIYIRRGALHV